MGDDDELALRDETIEHAGETIDVALIHRRVDFVEHAKWTRAYHVNGKEQRDRGHRAFAAAQE